MFKRFRTYLLRGVLILLPAGATVLLVYQLYTLLDDLILRHISQLFQRLGFPSPAILDLISFIFIIALIGFVGGNFLGRWLVSLINFLINKIPWINTIYAALQQILETIFKENKTAFSKVALVEYPRKGLFSIGFITAECEDPVKSSVGREAWSIFIPTTPNPTSGVLIFAPKEEVEILDITVDRAAKLVMSAGVINSETQSVPKERIHILKASRLFKKITGAGN